MRASSYPETLTRTEYLQGVLRSVVGLLRYAVQIGVIDFEEWVASYHPLSLILPRTPSPDTDHPTPD